MRNVALRGALAILIGLALGVMGRWEGYLIAVVGLLFLAIGWRFRNRRPIDPEFIADLEKAMRLEKSDPEAASNMIDAAVLNADKREERVLSELRRRAATDRKAALELRSRLRQELDSLEGARRSAERSVGATPHGAALLQEMDRSANATRHELAQLEQYLAQLKTS